MNLQDTLRPVWEDCPTLLQPAAGFDSKRFDLNLTGFEVQEIEHFLGQQQPDADMVPPPPAEAVTRAGDLWLCGPHAAT